ncbi:glycoside hydrolase superfamily [Aspergillus californicus]
MKRRHALSSPNPGDLKKWLKESSVYQNLGADIVWLNAVFYSPQVDNGYDISDYYAIYPAYGSLQDMDELVAQVHARGMNLMIDLVVNHTSDQHRLFQVSRASVDNAYRDWYIWRKPVFRDGARYPPNNWRSYFRGGAWTYDKSGEYYLRLFTRDQPDLNSENPRSRDAVHDIVRYCLNHGADGFRMDIINVISKDQSCPDAAFTNPDSPWQSGKEYYAARPRLHSVNLDHGPTDKFGHREWGLGELKAIVGKREMPQTSMSWRCLVQDSSLPINFRE